MADEDFLLQCHAFTDKAVAGNLAAAPDFRALLNFHERANLYLVADLTAIKVGEPIKPHALAQLYVRCDSLEKLPDRFRAPPHAQTNSDLRAAGSLGAFVREVPLRVSEISTARSEERRVGKECRWRWFEV